MGIFNTAAQGPCAKACIDHAVDRTNRADEIRLLVFDADRCPVSSPVDRAQSGVHGTESRKRDERGRGEAQHAALHDGAIKPAGHQYRQARSKPEPFLAREPDPTKHQAGNHADPKTSSQQRVRQKAERDEHLTAIDRVAQDAQVLSEERGRIP